MLPTGAGSAGLASLARSRCLPGGHSHPSPLSDTPVPQLVRESHAPLSFRSLPRGVNGESQCSPAAGRAPLPAALLLTLPSSFF